MDSNQDLYDEVLNEYKKVHDIIMGQKYLFEEQKKVVDDFKDIVSKTVKEFSEINDEQIHKQFSQRLCVYLLQVQVLTERRDEEEVKMELLINADKDLSKQCHGLIDDIKSKPHAEITARVDLLQTASMLSGVYFNHEKAYNDGIDYYDKLCNLKGQAKEFYDVVRLTNAGLKNGRKDLKHSYGANKPSLFDLITVELPPNFKRKQNNHPNTEITTKHKDDKNRTYD